MSSIETVSSTETTQSGAGKFDLNKIDRKKIGKGALIAIGGALFTYLESLILSADFGQRTPVVMMVNSIIVNIVQKRLTDNSVKPLPDATVEPTTGPVQ